MQLSNKEKTLRRVTVKVPSETPALRIDTYLAQRLSLSRSYVKKLIKENCVKIHSTTITKPAYSLKGGEEIEVTIKQTAPYLEQLDTSQTPQIDILYKSKHFLVLNKPAGIVVHPGSGNTKNTLASFIAKNFPQALKVGHPLRPGIVHRLDKGTSGVMVVALTQEAYNSFVKQFSNRLVKKLYIGITYGKPSNSFGVIESKLARSSKDRKKIINAKSKGKTSLTIYKSLADLETVSVLALFPVTGRTHQLRVHLKYLGTPLIGDSTYAGINRWKTVPNEYQECIKRIDRPLLHSFKISFIAPNSDRRVTFKAPIPNDIKSFLGDYFHFSLNDLAELDNDTIFKEVYLKAYTLYPAIRQQLYTLGIL